MSYPDIKLIKALTHKLVKAAGGVEAAAYYAETSPAMISNYCNLNTNYTVSVKALVLLSNVTQDDTLINHINEICGQQTSKNTVASFENVMMSMAKFHKEGSEFTTAALEAMADQKLTPVEVSRLQKELIEAQDAMAEVLKQISAWGQETTATTENLS